MAVLERTLHPTLNKFGSATVRLTTMSPFHKDRGLGVVGHSQSCELECVTDLRSPASGWSERGKDKEKITQSSEPKLCEMSSVAQYTAMGTNYPIVIENKINTNLTMSTKTSVIPRAISDFFLRINMKKWAFFITAKS